MNKEMEDFKNSLETEEEKRAFEKLCKIYNQEITPIDFFKEVMAA